ncbi:MAG TPA: TetR family transcriptional regulator [Aldersonia sp.]
MTQEALSGRTYAGQPVADRQRERRARFLESGLTVFARDGYPSSSVGAICKVASLSSRQFYEEFTGREALLIEIYVSVEAEARQAVAAALAANRTHSAATIIDAGTRAYVETVGNDPRKARVALVEVVGASPLVELHRARQRQEWSRLLAVVARQAATEGEIPAGDYEMRVSALMGAVNYVVYDWSIADPRPPLDDVIRVLRRILLGAIGA